MSAELLDAASPAAVCILRTGVELYLARCEADRSHALDVGSDTAAEYWGRQIDQARALLARLDWRNEPPAPEPSAFVRQPRTVIRGRRTQLTCDDDA